jgi:hypothetical protein
LYVASIVLLRWTERRAQKHLIADVAASTATGTPPDPPPAS